MEWTTLILIIFLAVAVYWFTFAVRIFSPVPGPKLTFPMAPILEMLRDDIALGKHHLWLDRLRKKWGGVVRMQAEWGTSYMMFSPDAVKHILQTNWQKYDHSNKLMEIFKPIAGGLVLQPNGESWQHDRELFELGFKAMRLNRAQGILASKISKTIEILNKAVTAGETVDLQSLFGCMTFDVIGIFTLGHDFNTLEDPHARINKAWHNTLEYLMWILFIPRYYKIYETEFIRKGKEDLKFLEDQFFKIIQDRQQNPIDDDQSLLGLILESSKEHPDRYNLESIKIHMMTFLFAGHDTTANTLGWLAHFVSLHPEVESKLIAELDTTKGKPIEPATFSELPYLSAVVKETLRLKPSAPSLGRILKEADDYNGWHFTKGSLVGYSPYVTNRDEQYWPNADAFMPERFSPENYKNIHPYQYIPFGAGPRRCIGEQLALREIKTATAMILPLFKFTPVEGHPIEECVRTTMSAKYGIPMRVAHR